MLQPMLRRPLAAALLLGGLAAGLLLSTESRPPGQEARLLAETAAPEAAPWHAPWLRPPRDVVMPELQARRSSVDPLLPRRARRARVAGAASHSADFGPGMGIDVPAPVADPGLVPARAGGGDIPPPLSEDRQRVALPAWVTPLTGSVAADPDERTRKALQAGARAPRTARAGSPAPDVTTPAPGGSNEPAPATPTEVRVASAAPAPVLPGPPAIEPAPFDRPVPGIAPTPVKPLFPSVMSLAPAKPTSGPLTSKPALVTPKPAPAPVAPKPGVIEPHASPARPAPGVSLRPIVPGVPAELAPLGPPSDVIVWRRDEVENLVARDALGHGRGLHVAGGGHLGGSGRVGGNVRVAGIFAPGHSPGYVEIQGDYVQDAGATLEIELAGIDPADFDRVVVEGSAFLSGVIQVLLLDGFVPSVGDIFEVLLAAAILDLGVDIRLPDLGPGLTLRADWIASDAGDALVLRALGGASAAALVPEPATALLLGAGLLGLAWRGRRV